MTETVEGATITALPPGRRVDIATAAEYLRCSFSGTIRGERERHVLVSGVTIRDCHVHGGSLAYVTVEDCVIDGLATKGMPKVGASRFRHVTLRGRLGRVLVNGIGHPDDDPAVIRREAESGYYSDVDWALDITELDAYDFSLKGTVPGRLVRHDPQTAGVMTLATARTEDWRSPDRSSSFFDTQIVSMVTLSRPDDVLIAPRTGTRAAEAQQALAELRSRGLLEEPSC